MTMERILTVKHIAERYSCSAQCARNYIRRISGHLENPLGVYESDLMAWEHSRRVGKGSKGEITFAKIPLIGELPKKMIIPRTRIKEG